MCRQVVNNIVGAALARQNDQERALQERREAAKRAQEEAAAKVGPVVKSQCIRAHSSYHAGGQHHLSWRSVVNAPLVG